MMGFMVCCRFTVTVTLRPGGKKHGNIPLDARMRWFFPLSVCLVAKTHSAAASNCLTASISLSGTLSMKRSGNGSLVNNNAPQKSFFLAWESVQLVLRHNRAAANLQNTEIDHRCYRALHTWTRGIYGVKNCLLRRFKAHFSKHKRAWHPRTWSHSSPNSCRTDFLKHDTQLTRQTNFQHCMVCYITIKGLQSIRDVVIRSPNRNHITYVRSRTQQNIRESHDLTKHTSISFSSSSPEQHNITAIQNRAHARDSTQHTWGLRSMSYSSSAGGSSPRNNYSTSLQSKAMCFTQWFGWFSYVSRLATKQCAYGNQQADNSQTCDAFCWSSFDAEEIRHYSGTACVNFLFDLLLQIRVLECGLFLSIADVSNKWHATSLSFRS